MRGSCTPSTPRTPRWRWPRVRGGRPEERARRRSGGAGGERGRGTGSRPRDRHRAGTRSRPGAEEARRAARSLRGPAELDQNRLVPPFFRRGGRGGGGSQRGSGCESGGATARLGPAAPCSPRSGRDPRGEEPGAVPRRGVPRGVPRRVQV